MTGSNPVPPKVSSFGRSGSLGSLGVDWWMVAIFAVAVLIRIPPLFASTLWYDDGVEGLMSQDVLRGRFPLFFYGQPAHGAADRYLAALALLVFGPTTHALKLAALGLFFVFLWSLAYTTQRIYGRVVATIAALLVAVPPYYLFGWSFDARGHYHLMLIFGAWALYLAWRIGQEGVGRSPERRFIGLGFLAGLAWWTNYLSITFLAPITVALGLQAIRQLRREWRPLLRRGLAAAGAFACGVAPLLGYYVGHRLSLLPPGTGVSPETIESHLMQLIVRGLPQILGVHPRIWGPAYAVVYGVLTALSLAALVFAATEWLRGRRQPVVNGGTLGPLLGLVVVTLLLSTLTAYGAIVRYPRYLLPLYLALPVLLGVAFQRLGRRWPAAMWILVAAIALNNLLGALVESPVLSPHQIALRQRWQIDLAEQFEQLDRLRLNRVYGGSNLWPYLSDRRVLAADPTSERMIELAHEVDAATRVGWVLKPPTRAFEQSAHAAGIRYRRVDSTGFVFYSDFELPSTGYADIDPAAWSARASPNDDVARAFDRQIPTAWRAGREAGGPTFYQLDLGRPHLVGMLTWLPERWEELEAGFGFRVGLSLDARTWQEVVAVSRYAGPLYWSGTHPFGRPRRSRVELRFPATEAQHVRIDAQAAAGWAIRELFVGTPVTDCPRAYDPAALTRWLLETGIRFAYADHWLSANIVKESRGTIGVLPSNRSVNSYRLVAPDPNTVEAVRFRSDRAVVVEDCPPEVANAVGSLLRDSEVEFTRHDVGGLVVFFDFREPPHPDARVLWRAEGPGGGTILVQLGTPRTVDHVVVGCDTPFVSPIPAGTLGLETSDDAVTFTDTPIRLLQPAKLRMSGSRLLRDAPATVRLEFGPRRVRALRVVTRATGWEWCHIRTVRLGGGP